MRLGSQVEVKGDSARLVSAQWPMLEDELTGRYWVPNQPSRPGKTEMNSQSLHVSKSSHGFRSFHVHTCEISTIHVETEHQLLVTVHGGTESQKANGEPCFPVIHPTYKEPPGWP